MQVEKNHFNIMTIYSEIPAAMIFYATINSGWRMVTEESITVNSTNKSNFMLWDRFHEPL